MVKVDLETEPIYKGKKATHLPLETVVYVPSTNKFQKSISQEEMNKRVLEVRRFLSNINGGYTSATATGGYVLKNKQLVNEDVVKVTSFTTIEKFKKNKNKVHRMLRFWTKKWGQESIGYEYEGDMYYI